MQKFKKVAEVILLLLKKSHIYDSNYLIFIFYSTVKELHFKSPAAS